ncbi:MAG TPA: spherulation-specific family 4 protein, partial [Polyangia bacterium]|nr:spherulation-specific family 4 protein [Polyangia bacterium]
DGAGNRDTGASVDAAGNRDTTASVDAAANEADAGAQESDARGGAAGTIVPLYTYPDDPSWTAIVAARKAHPSVRVVAIVNPDNGPGASKDGAFTTGIAKLHAGDVQAIGYVATGYASHSLASMQAAIDEWKTFYPQIEGIFFDEQSDQAADVPYYRTLSRYAKAQGLAYTVGNPGADTPEAFVGVLDTMLIYESKGLPALSKLGGWHSKYAVSNFGVIPYGTPFDAAFVQQARQYVGYIYLQNDDLPNPWDTLPPYFGDLLAALE